MQNAKSLGIRATGCLLIKVQKCSLTARAGNKWQHFVSVLLSNISITITNKGLKIHFAKDPEGAKQHDGYCKG